MTITALWRIDIFTERGKSLSDDDLNPRRAIAGERLRSDDVSGILRGGRQAFAGSPVASRKE
jgi:hypothetical protein